MKPNNVHRVTLVLVATALVFLSGYFSAGLVDASSSASKLNLNKFWEAAAVMQSKYPFKDKAPKASKQVDGAIAGLVASYGDPYTVYMGKDQLKSLKDDVKGSFSGIGIEIGMKDGLLTVIAPIKGSPAEKAGFLAGDIIYKVAGKEIGDMPMDEIIQLIRGPRGTRVDIEIVRKNEPKPITLSPIRDTIKAPNTAIKKQDGYTIISLYTFTRDSIAEIYDALQKANAEKSSGVIIDLRNNPGGLLDSAVEIGSMILPKNKTIVLERPGSNGLPEETYKSNGYGVLDESIPLVILVDGGSASASEILSGALHDHNRATLMGAKTFGKGSVQELVDLSDGSGIKVTVAKWYTPNNVSISEKGITPDILVTDTNPTDANDEVLAKAIDYLKNK